MKTQNLLWSLIILATMSLFVTSCKDDDPVSGSDAVDSTMIHFSIDATDKFNPTFTNTSDVVGIATWNFGNGLTGSGDDVTSEYAIAETYTITMTLLVEGASFTSTEEYVLDETNTAYFDNPMVIALTGGSANAAGKTWVMDKYASDHMVMWNDLTFSEWWWAADPMGKDGKGMYDDEYTLKVTSEGIVIDMKTNNDVYVNGNLSTLLGDAGFVGNQEDDGNDWIFEYPDATFACNISETDSTMIFSDGGFMGLFGGYKPAEYMITGYSDTTLYIAFRVGMTSPVEGAGAFIHKFVLKGFETDAPAPPTTGIIDDDFESGEIDARWQLDTQDDATTIFAVVDNPDGAGKVFQFGRQTANYPNIQLLQDEGSYFDFASAGVKVAMDVYVPTSNDYTTDGNKAGDWITIPDAASKESMSVEVKFQNSTLGANSWQTQMTLKSDVLKDYAGQWVTLLFDMSDAYTANANDDKTSLDKFVLQFGSEGYSFSNSINFYFDNIRWFDGSKTAETGWIELNK